MSTDFLSILDDTNSIKNETTGEIIITVPSIQSDNYFEVLSPCIISSNCNTVITCKYFEISAQSVSISNINFETTVLAQCTEKLSVSNCEFKNAKSGLGVFTISFCADVTISHIAITNTAQIPGLYICQNSTVVADHINIHDIPYTLLACDGCSTLKITESNFTKAEKNGIHVSDQSSIEISNSLISDTGYPGIIVNDSQCTIRDNELRNIAQNSISLSSSEKFLIENNTINNGGATAISVERSIGVINSNKITKVQGNGIHCSNNSDVQITNNEINDASYPGIAVISNAKVAIFKNKITKIELNGICSRGAKDVRIQETEIKDVKECGISISDTDHFSIENCLIENCGIMAVECYNNSKVYIKDNVLSNVGKYAFLSYTSGYINAENNKIDGIQNAMVKLVYKGGGDFVNNRIDNCPNQFECQTTSHYFFSNNGTFPSITNDESKSGNGVLFEKVDQVSSNFLCIKCQKNKRDCFILNCGHKVYCTKCAEQALENKEKCPLCRFPIEKISTGFDASNDENCTICFENKSDCIILPCGHMGACASCLEDWFKNKKSCPFCRAKPCFYKKIIEDF